MRRFATSMAPQYRRLSASLRSGMVRFSRQDMQCGNGSAADTSQLQLAGVLKLSQRR
jgi:hypothetical protein